MQRKLYEAGTRASLAGGVRGQGLPPEYELALEEEARDSVLPAHALHGGTFGWNAPTMLVDAEPEFLRWFVPRCPAVRLDPQFFSEPSGGVGPGGGPHRATNEGIPGS